MKIRIEENGHSFTVPFPIRLALNPIAARIIAKCIKKYTNVPLKEENLRVLSKELIHSKRSFGKLVLVDVSSSDNTRVRITL